MSSPPVSPIKGERGPNDHELALWNKAEKIKQRVVLIGYLAMLQQSQLNITVKYAASKGLDLADNEIPELESKLFQTVKTIEVLRKDHDLVNGMQLGVQVSQGGGDLDIVQPPETELGAIWIPIAIGAVVIAGIIARWAFLEKEVQTISDRYNGILHHANQALCSNPDSQMCKDWTKRKQSGDYVQNETLIDSVKNAVSKVGGYAAGGLGAGIMVAIPLLMLMYLPKKRKS